MLFNFFVGLISLSYPYPNFPIFDWKHGIKHLKKNSKDFLSFAIAKSVSKTPLLFQRYYLKVVKK